MPKQTGLLVSDGDFGAWTRVRTTPVIPVNQAAAIHLDMASTSFGIQEENHFSDEELKAFPGHCVQDGGYMYANDQPGLRIDIDEEKAKALLDPERVRIGRAAEDRRADGSIVRP